MMSKMEKEYFISNTPGLSGYHKIHNKDCPFLPDPDKRTFLGYFSSPQDAELSGKQYFKRTYRCLFCSKNPGADGNELSDEPVTFENITPAWESVMMCGVN